MSEPILRHPDFHHPFILQTDASDIALGAVLSQRIDGAEHPTYYISRVIHPEERKWTIREKEVLAIIWSCEIFRPYLIGQQFIIETDHHSMQWLMKAKTPPRLVRRALRLSEYNFEIRHKSGKTNQNADTLSRMPSTDCLLYVKQTNNPIFHLLQPIDLPDWSKNVDPIKILEFDPRRRKYSNSIIVVKITLKQYKDRIKNEKKNFNLTSI